MTYICDVCDNLFPCFRRGLETWFWRHCDKSSHNPVRHVGSHKLEVHGWLVNIYIHIRICIMYIYKCLFPEK